MKMVHLSGLYRESWIALVELIPPEFSSRKRREKIYSSRAMREKNNILRSTLLAPLISDETRGERDRFFATTAPPARILGTAPHNLPSVDADGGKIRRWITALVHGSDMTCVGRVLSGARHKKKSKAAERI